MVEFWSRRLQCSLESYLLTRYKLDSITQCWEFTNKKRSGPGYGAFTWNNECITVHRAAYQLWRGPIPDGLLVCHTCDNKICFNPDHLFIGTMKDNVADMIQKGRRPSNRVAMQQLWKQGVYDAQLRNRGDRNSNYMKRAWAEGKFDFLEQSRDPATGRLTKTRSK